MMLIPHLITRYLMARRGFTSVVTGFSVGGIVLGVAALIVVMAVMAGFRAELLTRILGVTGHMTVSSSELTNERAEELQQQLLEYSNIVSATPYIYGQGLFTSGRGSSGAVVRGLAVEDLPALVTENMAAGDVNSVASTGYVLLGQGLANQLGVHVGQGVTLLAPEGTDTAFGFIPRLIQVRVGGVFEVGMAQYDNGLAYLNLTQAQQFMNSPNKLTALDVRLNNPDDSEELAQQLRTDLAPDARIGTWQQVNSQFFAALQVERVSMFIILSLIVLVAAFNIITGQIMLVADKRGDIAILRTMGARQSQILAAFFWNGALLGGLGTILGTGLGLLVLTYLHEIVSFIERLFGVRVFSGEVYFLDEIPVNLQMGDVVFVVGFSLLLTLLAALYPAWRAGRLDPVKVLRSL